MAPSSPGLYTSSVYMYFCDCLSVFDLISVNLLLSLSCILGNCQSYADERL